MTIAATIPTGPIVAPQQSCLVERLALLCVWVTVASGAVVFSEPAPVDVLTSGLIILLPLVGLTTIRPALVLAFCPWLAAAAGAFLANIQSEELDRSNTHALVSVYLYLAAFVIAGFVANAPKRHTRLILDAYLWAASIAAVAGIVGYFALIPGVSETFTRFGRAAGTFKDPNVFGAFLAVAIVYALHRTVHDHGGKALLAAVKIALLTFAILLSFSRGAWFNAAVGIAVYAALSLALAQSNRQRLKLLLLGSAALALGTVVLLVATQTPEISKLLVDRAALTQGYDEGPEGRFGGQAKALRIILENPLGLGALQFGAFFHHEDAHNVYLSMFMNAGWIGGIVFALMMMLTIAVGGWHLTRTCEARGLFVVAYAAFVATALEGFIVDIDHWRHLYLLQAILWGLMTAPPRMAGVRRPRIIRA